MMIEKFNHDSDYIHLWISFFNGINQIEQQRYRKSQDIEIYIFF